jgi:hypothetical protein
MFFENHNPMVTYLKFEDNIMHMYCSTTNKFVDFNDSYSLP